MDHGYALYYHSSSEASSTTLSARRPFAVARLPLPRPLAAGVVGSKLASLETDADNLLLRRGVGGSGADPLTFRGLPKDAGGFVVVVVEYEIGDDSGICAISGLFPSSSISTSSLASFACDSSASASKCPGKLAMDADFVRLAREGVFISNLSSGLEAAAGGGFWTTA